AALFTFRMCSCKAEDQPTWSRLMEPDQNTADEVVVPAADDAADTPDTDSPTLEGGQADEGGETEAAEPTYFNVDEYRDHKVKVKVDGEEIEAPLAEVLAGYSRQSDYTKKTQELAAERARLQQAEQLYQALQQNPEHTLRVLQASYGQFAQPEPDPTPEFDDPRDQRIWELEQRLNQVAASYEDDVAARQLNAVMVQMQQQFGDEFNPQEVAARMDQMGIYDPRMVPQVHYQIMGERYYQQKKAEMEYQAKQQAETASRVAAKEDASVVS